MNMRQWARTVLSHYVFTGISTGFLERLICELGQPWQDRVEGDRYARRGCRRRRVAGAGRKYELVFADRVLVTLAVLRLQIPHAALAVMFGVDRSTITRAVHQIRPLLAKRGFRTPEGPRLRTLHDVFAYAARHGITLRVDGSEIQVRRPTAHTPGRRAFVSGKRKQNTIMFTEITGDSGRTLWAGAFRPGRMHDQTAIKTEGIQDLFRLYPDMRVEVDAGYRGLAKTYPTQVNTPPKKPTKNASNEDLEAWEKTRHAQSSNRICVEHGIAELKAWRSMQRYIGCREYLPETIQAIAGIVSDRTLAA
jgi:hypothetical protein